MKTNTVKDIICSECRQSQGREHLSECFYGAGKNESAAICCLKCGKPILGLVHRTSHGNPLCGDCESMWAGLLNIRKCLDGSQPLDIRGAVMAIDIMLRHGANIYPRETTIADS